MENKIYVCKEYVKSKYDNICSNCNSNKSYCDYSRTIKLINRLNKIILKARRAFKTKNE